MSSVVIVALPDEDDRVQKISSEKIPHLTLLYLGEEVSDSDLANIVQFVEHTASELSPFGLTVDYRGTLGDDDADVLFFRKDGFQYPRIKDFRHYLLLDDTVRKAYESADQFPEWNPHLTLGYPTTPAKPDESDYPGIKYVDFNRIAVWFGDSEGPTFRLHYEDFSMEVAMSDISVVETGNNALKELFHYGKKGMKWGVRNDKGHEGEQVKTKKLDKLDKKWEKENTGQKAFWKAHNSAAARMNNGEIDRINQKLEHKKAADEGKFDDWLNPTPELNAYMKDMDDTFNKHYNDALVSLGSNPSGSKRYKLTTLPDGTTYAQLAVVKHAEGDQDVRYKIAKDDKGMITSYTPEEVTLKHYGVKGMRWGVTTTDRASSPTLTREKKAYRNTKDVTVTQRKAGTYVKTKGGQRQKATDDAVKAAAARQKAKKSTTDALTNDELKAAVERMNLEQQYQRLDAKTKRRGQGFISQLFASPEARRTTADLAKRIAEQS